MKFRISKVIHGQNSTKYFQLNWWIEMDRYRPWTFLWWKEPNYQRNSFFFFFFITQVYFSFLNVLKNVIILWLLFWELCCTIDKKDDNFEVINCTKGSTSKEPLIVQDSRSSVYPNRFLEENSKLWLSYLMRILISFFKLWDFIWETNFTLETLLSFQCILRIFG